MLPFVSGLVVLFLVALAPAFVAARNGRDFRLWWILGVLLPVVAIPVAVLAGPPTGMQDRWAERFAVAVIAVSPAAIIASLYIAFWSPT